MRPFLYRKTAIYTAITLYPLLIVLFMVASKVLKISKIDLFSVAGMIIYFGFFLIGYLAYAYFHEKVICKNEP